MNEELFNRIDRYLANALSEEERQAFEAACKTDSELREALKIQIRARYAAHQTARQQQRAFYEEQQAQGGSAGTVRPFRMQAMRQYFAVAAVLVILFSLTYILLNYYQNNSPDALYQEYFADSNLDVVRSQSRDATDTLGITWQKAIKDYQKGDFEASATGFETVLANDTFPNRDQANLYLGMTYLKLGKTDAAITSLSRISQENSSLRYDRLWLTAMAHLKNKDIDQARSILEELKESRDYREDAEKLLKALDRREKLEFIFGK